MDIVRIARHARAHRGVITQTHLDTIGVNSSRAGHEVRAGRWRRLHEGVFTAAATPDSWELRAEAALAALPAGVLGLRAAARVHHLDLVDTTLDVVVPHGGRHRLDGVTVHQSSVPEWHVVRRNGWRVTTLERTLVDLGKVVPTNTLQRCIEDQIVDRRTTMARVESVFGELAGRGRPGIARTHGARSPRSGTTDRVRTRSAVHPPPRAARGRSSPTAGLASTGSRPVEVGRLLVSGAAADRRARRSTVPPPCRSVRSRPSGSRWPHPWHRDRPDHAPPARDRVGVHRGVA